jgi:hypothetical protein
MSEPHRVVTFRGGVSCRRDTSGPLGLTLIGWTTEHPEERVSLAFAGRAPDTMPDVLEEPTVDRIDERRYRITSAPREWLIEATTIHIHRDVANAFYRAIPPRDAPWSRRFFWRVALALASNSWGKRLLLALRRR